MLFSMDSPIQGLKANQDVGPEAVAHHSWLISGLRSNKAFCGHLPVKMYTQVQQSRNGMGSCSLLRHAGLRFASEGSCRPAKLGGRHRLRIGVKPLGLAGFIHTLHATLSPQGFPPKLEFIMWIRILQLRLVLVSSYGTYSS